MVKKRLISIITALMLLLTLIPVAAFAQETVTLNAISNIVPGGSVEISGATTLGEVTIKVIRPNNTILYIDVVTASNGAYTNTFKMPADAATGTYNVVVGQGNVATGTFTVQYRRSGGGGGTTHPAVTSTTGSATVNPAGGGNISLGSDVSVNIPAGALNGTTGVDVVIQKLINPPASPSGFMVLGQVFEFKVGGAGSYTFNKPVKLTFTFDPTKVPAGTTPTVYYYDLTASQWVSIGGTVSGNTITVTVDHFTLYAVMAKEKEKVPAAITFPDIANHWAKQNIEKLVALGIIKGYSNGTFKPDNSITRAEFATVLARSMGWQENTEAAKFTDSIPAWAKGFIGVMVGKGVVKGYEDNTFRPDKTINRAEMAVMIVRAMSVKPSTTAPSFADSADIPAWARGYISAAADQGIIKGYSGNILAPGDNSTRAETAVMLVRMMNKLGI